MDHPRGRRRKEDARIEQLKDAGRRYEKVFGELGVSHVRSIPLERRADCEQEAVLDQIRSATGVFMTGGNQLRLSTNLGGTSVARLLRRRNREGLHIAGTSAGAAFLCEHMIAFGDEGPTPLSGMVTLAPGLGLTNRVMIDQHFRERDRLGRLMTALAYNPFSTGIGLDEDTSAFIDPDERIEVVGSGGLTIIDSSHIEHSAMDSTPKGKAVGLIGVRLHILVHGDSYDLHKRIAEAAPSSR
jgi:cyanophycinase